MLDGFNAGWIEFEGGQAGSRKGTTTLHTALEGLVALAADPAFEMRLRQKRFQTLRRKTTTIIHIVTCVAVVLLITAWAQAEQTLVYTPEDFAMLAIRMSDYNVERPTRWVG